MNKLIYLFMTILTVGMMFVGICTYTVNNNNDDGTELNLTYWYENGLSDINYVGMYNCVYSSDCGLRFKLDNIDPSKDVVYARLLLDSRGTEINSSAKIRIKGVLQTDPSAFSIQSKPSNKTPKTINNIPWEIEENWDMGSKSHPMWYATPNIASIINEIINIPGWSSGNHIALVLEDASDICETNYISFVDWNADIEVWKSPAKLELYYSVYDTIIGKEMVGEPTNSSATINIYSLMNLDVCVWYGTESGAYTYITPEKFNNPSEQAIEIDICNLSPNTKYYYKLAYKVSGTDNYEFGEEHSFWTQRASGETFAFAVIADEHIQKRHILPQVEDEIQLYNTTIDNISNRDYDFLISLGDCIDTQFSNGRDAKSVYDAKLRNLMLRSFVDKVTHSAAFYLCLGNHEGEQSWYYKQNTDRADLPFLSLEARKEIIPNPSLNSFYGGNTDPMPHGYGLREDYFSWTWGDALFIVLDPYHYTDIKPNIDTTGWCWTLGELQYRWLYNTLAASSSKWKFIFIHHLVSTPGNQLPPINPWYGRGGIEVAKYKVSNFPSWEWGGEDPDGTYVFDQKRPGWNYGPIHDMLVEHNVTAVFHGHDHFFARQELDGVLYFECPQPCESDYDFGFKNCGGYTNGVFIENSGHIDVTISHENVIFKYVRAYLPGDGVNGEIAYEEDMID